MSVVALFGGAHAMPGAGPVAATPRDVLLEDGTARLYRFRGGAGGPPLLLVPSLINRWYIVDLRPGASLAEALVAAGFDVFCLDWGIPNDEDRYLDWAQVLDRLRRMSRKARRAASADRIAVLGYCMGGTLSAIHAALHPDEVSALINLAGPIDFAEAGRLAHMVDRRWFDADAVADAGNVSPQQMQAGFVALRPTLELGKWPGFFDRAHDPAAVEAFWALEGWASDNIPFPAEAYRTYITELYQLNRLVAGTHAIRGRTADLSAIRCPVLAIGAKGDTICPLPAARALLSHVSSTDTEVLEVPGGHVGMVVGSRARDTLYPSVVSWLRARLAPAPSASQAIASSPK